MQLAQAIDAWVDAHGTNFSVSTLRDIEHIRATAVEVCAHQLPHHELDRDVLNDIIVKATHAGTLAESAITEFLGFVLDWANAQEVKAGGDGDGLGPTGAFHVRDASDDESESGDGDDPIDPDLEDWVGYLSTAQDGDDFTGLPPENEIDTGTETVAAGAFFNAIGSSTPANNELVIIEEGDNSPEPKGGVFSAAAEPIPLNPKTGIDWVTAAYFVVAVICFALVIYFYLSSN